MTDCCRVQIARTLDSPVKEERTGDAGCKIRRGTTQPDGAQDGGASQMTMLHADTEADVFHGICS